MTPTEYDRHSEAFRTLLQANTRVLALVALGSTALPEQRDVYSDHDFWIVVAPGMRVSFLKDRSWLPNAEEQVATTRVGTRYLVTLDAGGHVMEFGVFEPDELSEGKLGAYRVVFDRGGISDRLTEVARQSPPQRPASEHRAECERLLVVLLTGAARAARGEHLSAHKYLSHYALDFLLDLYVRGRPLPHPELIDSLDPWRRVEQFAPELAADLRAAVALPATEAALCLLDITERELRGAIPEFPAAAAKVVRSALQRLVPKE